MQEAKRSVYRAFSSISFALYWLRLAKQAIPDLTDLNYVKKCANEDHEFRNTRLGGFYGQNTAFYRFNMSLFGAVWEAGLCYYGLVDILTAIPNDKIIRKSGEIVQVFI